MINIENISVTYNAGTANEVKALQQLSLQVLPKSFVLLLGSNGSGKSTFFNALSGTAQIDSGKIFIDNQPIHEWNAYKRSALFTRVFQNPLQGTVTGLSVIENFRIDALLTHSSKNIFGGVSTSFRKKVQEVISESGLPLANRLDTLMGNLSGGQRQALTLLMATMADCKVIMMDEPTAALDPRSAELVINTTQKIFQSSPVTIFYITHNMKEAVSLGNRLLIFKEGRIAIDASDTEKQKWDLQRLHGWFDEG